MVNLISQQPLNFRSSHHRSLVLSSRDNKGYLSLLLAIIQSEAQTRELSSPLFLFAPVITEPTLCRFFTFRGDRFLWAAIIINQVEQAASALPLSWRFSRSCDDLIRGMAHIHGLLLLADTSLVGLCVPTSRLFDCDCLFIRALPPVYTSYAISTVGSTPDAFLHRS